MHGPSPLALLTTLKVITGLQQGTLLLWTVTLIPGGSTHWSERPLVADNPARLASGGRRRRLVTAGE